MRILQSAAYCGLFMATVLCAAPGIAQPQQTSKADLTYLGSLYFPLAAPQRVREDLVIIPLDTEREGGLTGERVSAKAIHPCADWSAQLSNGNAALDVRCTLRTESGDLIYIEYSGLIDWSEEKLRRCRQGETLKGSDLYLRSAPVFKTRSEKYMWLNDIQAVGILKELKCGADFSVSYDIYSVD